MVSKFFSNFHKGLKQKITLLKDLTPCQLAFFLFKLPFGNLGFVKQKLAVPEACYFYEYLKLLENKLRLVLRWPTKNDAATWWPSSFKIWEVKINFRLQTPREQKALWFEREIWSTAIFLHYSNRPKGCNLLINLRNCSRSVKSYEILCLSIYF